MSLALLTLNYLDTPPEVLFSLIMFPKVFPLS